MLLVLRRVSMGKSCKIKVLNVIKRLTHGGAEHLVVNLCSNLNKDKFDVHVLVIEGYREDNDRDMLRKLEENKVTVHFLGKMQKGKEKLVTLCKIITFLKKNRPDIVHAHLEHCSIYTAVASLFYKRAIYIQTIHNTVLTNVQLLKILSKRFQRTIAISKEVEEVIKSELKIQKNYIKLIFNGVDTNRFNPIGKKSSLIEQNDGTNNLVINLLAIGRLASQKGHKYLIKALYNLINSGLKNLKLYIVGSGELQRELEALTKDLGIQKHVVLLGNRTEIPEIIRASHIYVMPSLWEGLSVSLLEAISMGIPIVATNVGSNESLLRQCDKLIYKIIEPCNENLIAQAIEEIINLNPKELLQSESRKNCLPPQYIFSTFVSEHESLYIKLIEDYK
jgi:glycosyltransferase involved in cell wall biosynthesis